MDPVNATEEVARLGLGVPAMLLPGNASATVSIGLYPPLDYPALLNNYSLSYKVVSTDVDWIRPLFTAAGIQNILGEEAGLLTYPSCMQTDDLIRAVEGAYKQYALQLMFSDQEFETWVNDNLTAAVPLPIIIGGGGVPPLLVLVCLLAWAVSCTVLGVVYGTKKRSGETFDVYSLSRYCEDVLKSDLNIILRKV